MKVNNILLVLQLVLITAISCYAQSNVPYQYDKDLLPASFFSANRDQLRSLMPDSSIAVFFSAPVRNRANDVNYTYHQDPDFYYLTGFTEPDALLIIFKTPTLVNGISMDEILFVPERDAERESWNGVRAGKEGAGVISGIRNVFNAAAFDSMTIDFNAFAKLWYQLPKGAIDNKNDNEDKIGRAHV